MYRYVVASISLLFMLFAFLVYLATTLPEPEGTFSLVEEKLAYSINDQLVIVDHFVAAGVFVEADTALIFEEPDVLETYQQMSNVFDAHRDLIDGVRANQLVIVSSNFDEVLVRFKDRSVFDLPGLFWLQSICALLALIICALVWIACKKSLPLIAFCLTGVGYSVSAAAASVYSTRAFFIDGQLYELLSRSNHIGAMVFVAALAVFLWHYPDSKTRKPIVGVIAILFIAQLLLVLSGSIASPAIGFYVWVLVVFALGLSGMYFQWRKVKSQPAERIVLIWILVSILFGTVFFIGGMIIPVLLRVASPSDQALLLATFLFMYFGMMFSVVRYRLFDIQRWSFTIWSWLLGGIAVLLFDLFLISVLAVSSEMSLAVSLAIVGWAYFPVRQWLWQLLFNRRSKGLENWLKEALPKLLAAGDSVNDTELKLALEAVFKPLSSSITSQSLVNRISSDGSAIWVPLPKTSQVAQLEHADNGRRIFNRSDIETADLIVSLYTLITDIATAKQDGAMAERSRIKKDMHDDLGAKLLRLMYRTEGDNRALVRDAIKDLRTLIAEPAWAAVDVQVCLEAWRKDFEDRSSERGVAFQWHAVDIPNKTISGASGHHLALFLTEAVSNALRAEQTNYLNVSVSYVDETLSFDIENNVKGTNLKGQQGQGLSNLEYRAHAIGGECHVDVSDDIWRVRLTVPLE